MSIHRLTDFSPSMNAFSRPEEKETLPFITPIAQRTPQSTLDSRPSFIEIADQLRKSVTKYLSAVTPGKNISFHFTFRPEPPTTPMGNYRVQKTSTIPESQKLFVEEESSCTLEEKFHNLRTAEEILGMGWDDHYSETDLLKLKKSFIPVMEWLQIEKKSYSDYEKTLINVDRLITELLARGKTEKAPEILPQQTQETDTVQDPFYSDYFQMRANLDQAYAEARSKALRFEHLVTRMLTTRSSEPVPSPLTTQGLREEDLLQDEPSLQEVEKTMTAVFEELKEDQEAFLDHKAAVEAVQDHLNQLLSGENGI